MWKQIRTCKDYFLLFDQEKYDIFITDFISIWYEYFSRSSFLDRLKENNSKLNMEENSLLNYGTLLVKYPESVNKVIIKLTEENFCITFVGSEKINKSIPFKIQLKLIKGTRKLFFQKVTSQLLKTIQVLNSSQQELCSLLKKKDVEIEDYKYEGAKVTIKANETAKFNEDEHTQKYCTEVVSQSIIDRIFSISEENSMKQESKTCDIKVEPCTSTSVTSIKVEPPSTPIEIPNEFNFPMAKNIKKESDEKRNQDEVTQQSLKRELLQQDTNDTNEDVDFRAMPTRLQEIKRESNITNGPRKKPRKFCF